MDTETFSTEPVTWMKFKYRRTRPMVGYKSKHNDGLRRKLKRKTGIRNHTDWAMHVDALTGKSVMKPCPKI